ncbi:MAG TPA: hypothetical protein VKQ31_06035 [Steroidobacteraceae bacterium]|nr:hypothetical protein [Steroidobacteraceae bacterium]
MTVQTGSAYKAAIDADTTALQGAWGKRRNVNGDGLVNQLVTSVALSGAWQYILDLWEAQSYTVANSSGSFGQVADSNFPAQVAIGTANLGTTGAVTVAFRTKMESRHVRDLLSATYQYGSPAHPFASIGLLAFQDSGAAVNVTPILRSADAVDNFSTMSNALTGSAQSLPSGAVTQLWWDGAGNAFQLDSLTNARNGLCLEIQFAMPTGLSGKALRIGDVQVEGGQVSSFYGRSSFGDELERAQRYYAKTFPLATAPAQNAGTAGALVATQGVGASASHKGIFWTFPTRMIKAPSLTLFNPSVANAQIRNLDTNTDCSASVADLVSEWGASFNVTTPAGSAAGQRLAMQLVADARL